MMSKITGAADYLATDRLEVIKKLGCIFWFEAFAVEFLVDLLNFLRTTAKLNTIEIDTIAFLQTLELIKEILVDIA